MTQDNLSLMRGGPVHRLLVRIGAVRPRLKTSQLIAIVLVAAAFLPLLIASAREGTVLAGRVTIPLSADYALLCRLLLAMPLLILVAPQADHLLRAAIRQFSRGCFVRHDQQSLFDGILDRTRRLRDSWLPELVCLLIAVVPVAAMIRAPDLVHLSSWHTHGGSVSWAGHWFNFVSVPIFRFVGLIWLWRFLLWTWLLWRFSRLDLDLRPPHPDRAGGLAFLGLAQMRFATLAVAGSLLLCGSCINQFLYAGQTFADMRYLLAGYIVGVALLLLAPLLTMTPPMLRAKRHALSKYSILGHRAIRHFDGRWKKAKARTTSMIP